VSFSQGKDICADFEAGSGSGFKEAMHAGFTFAVGKLPKPRG
jgi:hypothetical protein